MASRRLSRGLADSRPDGKVTYRLDASGPVEEGDIEKELLPLLYGHHPALEDLTGRLKEQPGIRELMPLGPEFFLAPPDEKGISRLGGVRLPADVRTEFLDKLRAKGWLIEE
jgi:hypothetical protein